MPRLEDVVSDALGWLEHTISLDSQNPPGNEQAMATYIADKLQTMDAEVDMQMVYPQRPNVLGRFHFGDGHVPNSPTLMLHAHTDTVPVAVGGPRDLLTPKHEAGKLYGRGACDDKGPLIAMLAACYIAQQNYADMLAGTLVLAAVMGEESGGHGSVYLVENSPLPNYVIVGEPTQLTPVLGHKGSYRKRFRFRGRAAHSSNPQKGVNAITHAAAFVLEVEAWNKRLQHHHNPLFGAPVVSANVIAGGNKLITIADACYVDVDRRLVPGETEASVGREVEEIVTNLRARFSELDVKISDLNMGKAPAQLPADHVLAQTLKTSIETVSQKPTDFAGYPAGTDMTFFSAAGVPAIIFGPGSLEHAHTAYEHIDIHEFQTSIEIYLKVICNLLAKY
ncbi:MAG: ArgE/DapE family deacylase [Deinococcota bacterium]